jgi:hypothetical protein
MMNLNFNTNKYTPAQWAKIKADFRRRRWGLPVAYVADEPDFTRYQHLSLWERFLNRWVI